MITLHDQPWREELDGRVRDVIIVMRQEVSLVFVDDQAAAVDANPQSITHELEIALLRALDGRRASQTRTRALKTTFQTVFLVTEKTVRDTRI